MRKIYFFCGCILFFFCGCQKKEEILFSAGSNGIYQHLDSIRTIISEGKLELGISKNQELEIGFDFSQDSMALVKHLINKAYVDYYSRDKAGLKNKISKLEEIIHLCRDKLDNMHFTSLKGFYSCWIKDYYSGIFFFEKALESAEKYSEIGYLSACYYNIVAIYYKLSNWEKILEKHSYAIKLAEAVCDKEQLTLLNYYVGKAMMETQNYEGAISFFIESENVAKKINNPKSNSSLPNKFQYMVGLARAHSKLGHEKLANNYFLDYSIRIEKFQKGLFNKRNTNFNLKQALELRNSENKALQLKSVVQKNNIILSCLLAAFLGLVSVLLFRNLKLKEKSNQILIKKSEEIQVAKNKVEHSIYLKTKFINQITHELRTPLHAINGVAYLLGKEKFLTHQKGNIQALQFSGKYLLGFINDIIDLNLIDLNNNVTISKDFIVLHELLTNISESINYVVVNKNSNFLEVVIEEDVPKCIIGDSRRLSQIIINSLNNFYNTAIKTKFQLKIELVKAYQKEVDVRFYIKQEVNNSNFKNIKKCIDLMSHDDFTIFKILESDIDNFSFTPAFANKLLKLFDSNLKFTFEGENLFVLYFDLTLEIAKNTVAKDYYEVQKKEYKILLVEDNVISQMVTKKIVEANGHCCDVVNNGFKALDFVKKNQYDLILMDIMMPGIDGFETTKRIRNFNIKIPIIALTALSRSRNQRLFTESSIQKVINKPFESTELLNSIQEQINGIKSCQSQV